ncbi:MAG: acetyl-CoA carboxylase biotin carboxyl carrier protein [Candidatus Obscuribacterales bacterium]|nr:acetyl-CoA carboxylase biotin carboxyl carrier protein [Candidatus Obscuribacterales bacterium]
MKFDLEQIRSLIDVVGETNVTELTIESGEEKITIKKAPPSLSTTVELPHYQVAAPAPAARVIDMTPEAGKKAGEESSNGNNGWLAINSPMVGTFYRASSPTAKPFVDVGDVIASGQTVCIIEAMKLMNDLPAEISGRVVKVCVDNGSTVEYGQPLFMVDPRA